MNDQKVFIDSKINLIPKMLGSIHEVKTEFRRSKIMIVGEGCAGKTAFANSIIGKKYEETDSTVGINTFMCSVTHAAFSKGEWKECDKIEKEYEYGIAERLSRIDIDKIEKEYEYGIAERLSRIDIEDDDLTQQKSSQIVGKKDRNDRDSRMEGKFSALKCDDYAVDHSKDEEREGNGVALDHTKGDSITDGSDQSSNTEVDKDMIFKCLANHVEIGANILISIFDYGGQPIFNVSSMFIYYFNCIC